MSCGDARRALKIFLTRGEQDALIRLANCQKNQPIPWHIKMFHERYKSPFIIYND